MQLDVQMGAIKDMHYTKAQRDNAQFYCYQYNTCVH